MKKSVKRIIAYVLSASLCIASVQLLNGRNSSVTEAAEESVNIGVDLGGYEKRGNLKSPAFEDWTVEKDISEAVFTAKDISFKLTAADGSVFSSEQNKTLMTNDTKPYLSCDGVIIGAGIKLEITGLSAGSHTLTTWHNYSKYSGTNMSPISLEINGVEKAKLTATAKAVTDDKAAYAYSQFDVKAGETVIVLIKSASDTGYSLPVLNAFELDGILLGKAVTDTIPIEKETHHEQEKGLSWKAAEGAESHDVYLGTSQAAVAAASKSSKEFMGNVSDCLYNFKETLSHLERYYWRVDEVFEDGTTVKGKVMWFDVVHLAFPSAEGYGRFAKGGRAGRVVEVTNLEDSGEGSLRQALEVEKGARTVIFRVGGIIPLKSKITIPSDGGNVYIAGQTAPGDGITVINYGVGMMGAEDVIVRNIRVRVGDMNGKGSDGMGMGSCNQCIIDHCSIAWSTDEGFSSRSAKNITFQWNIIAESLNNSVHYLAGPAGERPEGTERHGFAGSIDGRIGSFHHNLLVNNAGRNWSLAGALESDNKTFNGYLDLRNNVVYNWQNRTNDGGVRQVNVVNNYYKMGAASRRLHILKFDNLLTKYDTMYGYVSGNAMINTDGSYDLAPTDDAYAVGKVILNEESAISDVPLFESYIKTDSAEEAYTKVLKNVGANKPGYDYLDTRYLKETETGTYTYRGSKDAYPGIIDSQEDAGGYPTSEKFKGGEAPADSDHDGMPDEWEIQHKLNPNDTDDGRAIYLSDEGYTNLEMYLNELAGDAVVYSDKPVPSFTPSTPEPSESATQTPSESSKPSDTPTPNESSKPSDTPTPNESSKPSDTPTPSESSKPSDTPLPSESATPTPQVYILGDTDGDTKITARDALSVLKHAARVQLLSDDGIKAGDVNKDKSVDARDALLILKHVAVLITEF